MDKKTPRQKYKGFGEKPNPRKEAELRKDVIEIVRRNPIVGYIISETIKQVVLERLKEDRRREDAI